MSTANLSDDMPSLGRSTAKAPMESPPSIWRRVRRDVLLLGAGNIGVVIAQLGFRSILITALAPPDYGQLSLILSIYNTVWIIGASGLPNSVSRYIAINSQAADSAIIRSAVRAGAWPIIVAATFVAIVSGILLNSPFAYLFAAIGLACLVLSLLTMGILRGRGHMGFAALIMPIAAVGEVAPLAFLWLSHTGISSLSAFAIFCFGNVVGLVAGVFFTMRTTPREPFATDQPPDSIPTPRQLLGFSMWLAAATAGVAILLLVIRSAAALESYTVVAIIDVALVLFAIPQRLGSVIVMAVTPSASRALKKSDATLKISRRDHLLMIVPFVLAAAIVAFTPVVSGLFDLIGRPVYGKSAEYLALALLAGPARILYGVVEGVLIAHGEGRFLAISALSITAAASGMIFFATAVIDSTVVAFTVFASAFWVIYLVGLGRVKRLADLSMPAGRRSIGERWRPVLKRGGLQ